MIFGLFSAIGTFISSVASTIGPVLSQAASFMATKLPGILEKAIVYVDAISTIVTKVSEVLNIAPPGEKPEELGAKTMQDGTSA